MSEVSKITDLKIGNHYSNKQIMRVFGVSQSGGIRPNRKLKVIVLLHNPIESPYPDEWDSKGETLIYHGTDAGSEGKDQVVDGHGYGNGYIWNTWFGNEEQRNYHMYLFETVREGQKTYNKYRGQVYLWREPSYKEASPTNNRKVFLFPLKIDNHSPKECDKKRQKLLDKAYEERLNQAKGKTIEELERYSKEKHKQGSQGRRSSSKPSSSYPRDPDIVTLALKRANGVCDLCEKPAPFVTPKGPFLEVHHITWLSKGGCDDGTNVVALCPNCHRKIHLLKKNTDIMILKDKVCKYLSRNPN